MQSGQGGPVLGAERPTLIEHFIALLRLPYLLGCLALALLMGFPGLVLGHLLDTWDLSTAAQRVLVAYSERPAWIGVLDLTLNAVIVFYMLLMIRYMRQKIVVAEPALVGLISGGEQKLHMIFGRVSSPRGQLASGLTIAILIQAFLQIYGGLSTYAGPSGPLAAVFSLFIGSLFYLTAGTFVWIYAASLWGLHRFGKESLTLKSFHEDRLLGVGAVGSLSRSLTLSYYTVFGPIAFESLILSPDLVGYATVFPFIMLGGVMFFLPVYSIHERMIAEKRREEESIGKKIAQLLSTPDKPSQEDSQPGHGQVDKFIQLEMLRFSHQRLQDVPTWPYDKTTLQVFAAVFLSLLTALVTRLFLGAIGL